MISVAIYVRVSTQRQADKDLSIPDQLRTVREFCERKGWTVVAEFVEPGQSARDDQRPEFRNMIAEALNPDRPFDIILVHSFSRFFRDELQQELYIRKLAENDVLVQSATEEVGDGTSGELSRRILGIIAEFDNRNRQARVIQTMQENARQGFWNGGRPPYGYRTMIAEQRGDTAKKRLEINPPEAEIAREIYRLCLQGDGNGPMGIKAIVNHVNSKGLCYRNHRPFRVNEVHRILRSSTYMGLHHYNRKASKTGKAKDPKEWIAMDCPAIIEPDTFDKVQQHLNHRRPTVTAARLTNGAMLLTQIARCPHCGGGMTLRTGKSGQYRYYTCSSAATKGKASCKGRSIRMDALDGIVLTALEEKLLQPERLKAVLSSLVKRHLGNQGQSLEREKALRKEQSQIEAAINRMYEAIEDGLVGDTDLFRERLSKNTQRREELIRIVSQSRRRRELPEGLLKESNLKTFQRALTSRLRDPQSSMAKGYVRALVDRVTVGEQEITIQGSKSALLEATADPDAFFSGEVPSSVQDWRRERDSNPRYGYPYTDLANQRLQPLGHPSAVEWCCFTLYAGPIYAARAWLSITVALQCDRVAQRGAETA